MINVGIIGWRGMVGSVMLQRMQAEGDFDHINPVFFTTSSPNKPAPNFKQKQKLLLDANCIESLKSLDIVISMQGSKYTQKIHPQLRSQNWRGYWIDASSHLRMHKNSIIMLDPVNKKHIEKSLKQGCKDFTGGNCTVSLMLMAIAGLVNSNLVKAVQATTYQAISGQGAKAMAELFAQQQILANYNKELTGLKLVEHIHSLCKNTNFPTQNIGATLSANILPWIDSYAENGQSKEEFKAMTETNKILNYQQNITIDSTCVRTPSLRCHSQSLFIHLKENIPLSEINTILTSPHNFNEIIPNEKKDTLEHLSPISAENSLKIKIGRIRKANLGNNFLQLFTVGDQLLWGAAEPLRRGLRIILEHIKDNHKESKQYDTKKQLAIHT